MTTKTTLELQPGDVVRPPTSATVSKLYRTVRSVHLHTGRVFRVNVDRTPGLSSAYFAEAADTWEVQVPEYPLQDAAERILKELTGQDFQTVASILEAAGIIPEDS